MVAPAVEYKPNSEFNTLQPDSFRVNPQNGHWMYWRLDDETFGRRQGWIVPAPAWATAVEHNALKGMTMLRNYGTFLDENPDFTDRGGPPAWSVQSCPYYQLLARGGAGDLPVAQVIEFEWHRVPPRLNGRPLLVNGRPVEFPQIERDADGNVVLERDGLGNPTRVHKDYVCQHCGTVRKSETGLRNHEATVHKEIASTDQLARGLSKANEAQAEVMATALGGVLAQLRDAVSALGQRQDAQDERFLALMERMAAGENAPRRPGRPAKEDK